MLGSSKFQEAEVLGTVTAVNQGGLLRRPPRMGVLSRSGPVRQVTTPSSYVGTPASWRDLEDDPLEEEVEAASWADLEDGAVGELPLLHPTRRGREVDPTRSRRQGRRTGGSLDRAPRGQGMAEVLAQQQGGGAGAEHSSAQSSSLHDVGTPSSASLLEPGDLHEFLEDLGGEENHVDVPQSVHTSPMPPNMMFGIGGFGDQQWRRRGSRSMPPQDSLLEDRQLSSGQDARARGSRSLAQAYLSSNGGDSDTRDTLLDRPVRSDSYMDDRLGPRTMSDVLHSREQASLPRGMGLDAVWLDMDDAPQGLEAELPTRVHPTVGRGRNAQDTVLDEHWLEAPQMSGRRSSSPLSVESESERPDTRASPKAVFMSPGLLAAQRMEEGSSGSQALASLWAGRRSSQPGQVELQSSRSRWTRSLFGTGATSRGLQAQVAGNDHRGGGRALPAILSPEDMIRRLEEADMQPFMEDIITSSVAVGAVQASPPPDRMIVEWEDALLTPLPRGEPSAPHVGSEGRTVRLLRDSI